MSCLSKDFMSDSIKSNYIYLIISLLQTILLDQFKLFKTFVTIICDHVASSSY